MLNHPLLSKHLPLVLFLAALFVIHVAYFISAYLGLSDRCIPYIHSCTSISAAARKIPSIYFFKPIMVMIGFGLILFWNNVRLWLIELRRQSGQLDSLLKGFLWLGIITGGGLVLYAINLGLSGKFYFLMRRIGVLSFFLGIYSLEIKLFFQLRVLSKVDGFKWLESFCTWLRIIIVIIATLIVISILMSLFYHDYHSYDDAFEWWFMLLVLLPLFGVWRVWQSEVFNVNGESLSK